MDRAEVSDVFAVTEVTTRLLRDGSPVSDVTVEPVGVPLRGSQEPVTFVVTGGVVDGAYQPITPGSPRAEIGQQVFLILRRGTGGALQLDGRTAARWLVRTERDGVATVASLQSQAVVTGIGCDSGPVFESTDGSEGERATPVPVAWDDAMASLAACGGGR